MIHTPCNDFDFLIGTWNVRHRRLKERLAGCADWQVFEGTCAAYGLLGGRGNVDDHFIDLPHEPYRAATLRSFDASCGTWTLWWLDGRRPLRLDAPLTGRFAGGIGTFHGDDVWQDKPVRVRFLWTLAAPDSPRWEQAFSQDRGATWETDWAMDFTRSSAAAVAEPAR